MCHNTPEGLGKHRQQIPNLLRYSPRQKTSTPLMRCFTCARSLHSPCTMMQVSVRKDNTSILSHTDLLSFKCWGQGLLSLQPCGLPRVRGCGKRIHFHTFPCSESACFTPAGQPVFSAIAAMKQKQVHPPNACTASKPHSVRPKIHQRQQI